MRKSVKHQANWKVSSSPCPTLKQTPRRRTRGSPRTLTPVCLQAQLPSQRSPFLCISAGELWAVMASHSARGS